MLTLAEKKRLRKLRLRWKERGRLTLREEMEVRQLIDKKTPPVEKYYFVIGFVYMAIGLAVVTLGLSFYFNSPSPLHLCISSIISVFGLYIFFSSLTKLS